MSANPSITDSLRAAAQRPVFVNAFMLWGSTVVTSGMGFGFWVAAARLFPIASVGIASAAVAAMALLAQFGMLGLGTLLIGELAGDDFVAGLVSAAVLLAGLFSFLLGLGFVALQHVLSTKLGPLGHGVIGPLLFAFGVAISAVSLIIDQASIGLNRGGLQLARNTVFAFVKLVLLPCAALLATGPVAVAIYIAWAVGNVVSLGVFWLLARRSGLEPALAPAFRPLYRVRAAAFGHHWLNMAFQAPALLLPVIVSAVLSSAVTAAFFEANLIVGFAGIIPNHLSTALFALPRGDERRLAREIRATLRLSFAAALMSAIAFAALAHPVLLIFGHAYTVARTAMAVLGLSTIPFTVKTHYAAVERVRGRLMRCAFIATLGGLLEAGCCVAGVELYGLVGVAGGLVVALSVEAVFLWPVVARAAELSPLASPSWLWRSLPENPVGATTAVSEGDEPAGHSEVAPVTQSQQTPTRRSRRVTRVDHAHLTPDAPVFDRVSRARGSDRTGRLGQAVAWARFAVPVAGHLLWLLRHRRGPNREQVHFGIASEAGVVIEAMTFSTGPFLAPNPLLSVLRLEGPDGVAELQNRRRAHDLALGRLRAVRGEVMVLSSPAVSFAACAILTGSTPERSSRIEPGLRAALAAPETLAIAAVDRRGRFLGLGVAAVQGEEGFWICLLSASETGDLGDTRELLHAEVCAALARVGIKRLWADGPLRTTASLRSLQARLGYVCASFTDGDDRR